MKRLRRCGLKKTKPVRAVVDTNLFISGLFSGNGHTYQLQELWISGAFELVVSEQILNEIQRTLQKPPIKQRLQLQDGEEALIVELIKQKAAIVTTFPIVPSCPGWPLLARIRTVRGYGV